MVAYPFASDYLNRLEQAKVTENLNKTVEETSEEDLSVYRQQAQEFNERLVTGSTYVIDPFDPDAQTLSGEEYLSCLNLNGDGAMGRIVIPAIGVDLPIYHGTEGDEMNHGVGHMASSTLPVGGASTHAVLAGHTGLPSAVIFDRLGELKVGDYFVIQVLGEDLAYRVSSTETVLPDEVSSLGVQEGKDLVTLVTCTPYGINSHRLLVHAERCEVPDEWIALKERQPDAGVAAILGGDGPSLNAPVLIGAGLAAVVLAVVGIAAARRRRREARRRASSLRRRG